MTRTDLVPNRDVFAPYYDEVPELSGVRLRSVHLDAWGSVVALRLDLPRFPDRWGRVTPCSATSRSRTWRTSR
ncbi:hypothetical protein SCMC78_33500 [Streptomyces sp. CMC78]|uniref:Uncharacterized protein n=1 Tax=Streptomyces sp. CMC78 TaxID=3231512 RepID=A0AB33KIU1_9ACTN